MSSANPKAHEPSMEEILASIRRIIADDQEVLRNASSERDEGSHVSNVLELTERQTSQMLAQSRDDILDRFNETELPVRESLMFQADDHANNDLQLVGYQDEPDEGAEDSALQQLGDSRSAFSDTRGADTLLSSAANASVSDAFTRLGSTIMPAQPQTLEDLMKEMLRPMLKSWLDQNLPSLVERLVQDEIERISRERR